ncbi:hypothetical protein QBC38DRAFT_548738 [Podospora fimiseda]|uniref:Mid2 domain-containing protein n=1 Tax=Podospora fimiseda TaxID=252190 RepID=A0AAN7BGU5_9PEZI|nr:hypothetical protein QBC38DRAFT_548738 [Podospora fimiseda]
MTRLFPFILLFLSIAPRALSLTCYHVSGNVNKDENVIPCDPSVSGTPGSHTSCCNKGTGDQCLSTGLCLATNAKRPDDLFWINGCTDKTWRDPACPQYCNPPENPTQNTGHPRLKICANGTRYCCNNYYDNETDCCEHSFTLARGVGTLVAHLTDDASPSGSTTTPTAGPGGVSTSSSNPLPECKSNDQQSQQQDLERKNNTSLAAGVTGGILGTALIAAIVGLVFLWLQNRKLQHEIEEKKGELETKANLPQNMTPSHQIPDNKPYRPYYPVEVYGNGTVLAPAGYEGEHAPRYTQELPTSEGRVGQLP